ncbi:hypothetical protein WJX73_008165 [Symbiochloris irregularis]|uniref:Uncharacterized protein n=1 Tax=Symbiochloris irregularis TaxID=706552 RepID=A0AAW1NUX2_9CHLO
MISGAVPASAATANHLEQFSARFSGHWEGQEAAFSGQGRPEALPEDVIPAAMQCRSGASFLTTGRRAVSRPYQRQTPYKKDALDPALLSGFEPEEGYWQSAAGKDDCRPPELKGRTKAICLPLQAFAYAAQHGSNTVLQAGVIREEGPARTRLSGTLVFTSGAPHGSSDLKAVGLGIEGHV